MLHWPAPVEAPDRRPAPRMRALIDSLLGSFLTPWGLTLLAALDSSLVFFMPLGIDFVVVILAARSPDQFWLYALLASAGSVAGAVGTFWIGRKIGEHGLARVISPSRLTRIESRVRNQAAIGAGALAAIPPPFPFTPFVVAGGALGARPLPFLLTLAGARLLRFGVEAALAARYGERILTWMDSDAFEVVVGVLVVLTVGGTIASAVALLRGTRGRPAEKRAAS